MQYFLRQTKMEIKIRINGKEKKIKTKMTLASLLELEGIPLKGTAVELNREIVYESMVQQIIIKDGDVLELVRIVGGG